MHYSSILDNIKYLFDSNEVSTLVISLSERLKVKYRMAQKVRYRETVEYLYCDWSKRADFFTNNNGMFILHTYKGKARENLF
jgi:hypothetical protein